MSSQEKQNQINPIVPDALLHNTKALSNLQSLTASLFGVAAGILGLESYFGFLFYILFTLLTAVLFYVLRVMPSSMAAGNDPVSVARYFHGAGEFWMGGLTNGFPGFILTWTLFYGMVRA